MKILKKIWKLHIDYCIFDRMVKLLNLTIWLDFIVKIDGATKY
jgi:hypothetical protein